MSNEKKTYKPHKNHVGYISKSKSGNSIITVEQDMVLKAGDKLMIKKPQDNLKSLLDNGIIDNEKYEQRVQQIPEWKLSEISKIESNR